MGKRRAGFTLIELVVVLILIGISVALVAPTIAHSLEQAQFRKDVRSVSAMLTFARNQAITHKTPYRLSINIDEHMIWVNPYQHNHDELPNRPTQFSLAHTDTLRVTAKNRENTSGTHALLFYPNGSSSGGTIQMAHNGQKEPVVLKINAITGLATSARQSI
tara:strand:+ start:820 stop:1305 length:486 start_codon:yes stop_codon:yes gene_type:complete